MDSLQDEDTRDAIKDSILVPDDWDGEITALHGFTQTDGWNCGAFVLLSSYSRPTLILLSSYSRPTLVLLSSYSRPTPRMLLDLSQGRHASNGDKLAPHRTGVPGEEALATGWLLIRSAS